MKFDPARLAYSPRPNFYAGQLLSAQDIRAEQEYHIQQRWLHNRMLHGYGSVVGLEVGIEQDEQGTGTRITLSPGFGLDGWGRELIVPRPIQMALPADRRDLVVYLACTEEPADRTDVDTPSGEPRFIEAGVKLLLGPPPTDRAPSPSARPDYAIALARVRRPHLTWQRERTFRPPRAR